MKTFIERVQAVVLATDHPVVNRSRRRAAWHQVTLDRCLIVAIAFLILFSQSPAEAVPITGSNGTVVDFAGVKSAGPNGLSVQIKANGDVIEVPWEKFDLDRLRTEQPVIFSAYTRAQAGEVKELNMGTFAPKIDPSMREVKNFAEGGEKHGWFETGAGGGKFALQLPEGEPRAVLLVSMGQTGQSIRYMGGVGTTRWNEFANKFQLAVMSYEFSVKDTESTGVEALKSASFVKTEEGTGDAVLEALDSFAEKTKKPVLAKAPIAIFGFDVLGAAFAYNFTQSHPERVLATVAGKGAFYTGRPTEDSAKVPLMILWGEYDQDMDLWSPTDKHDVVYAEGLEMKPNWVYAMEPRTGPGETPFSIKMAMTFLDRMILARLNPEGGIKELDRSRSWVGDLKTFEIERMEDTEKVLEPTQTWLPDGEIAKLWQDFVKATMEP